MNILLAIVIVGIVVSLFDVPEKFQRLLYIVLLVAVVAWVFSVFGYLDLGPSFDFRVPRR